MIHLAKKLIRRAENLILSDRFLFYKRCAGFIFLVVIYATCVLFGDFVYNSILIHPIQDYEIFLFFVFASIYISWLSHDVKAQREILMSMLPFYMDESKRSAGVKKTLDDIIDQLDLYEGVRSILFFINLSVGGYIALCVSRALIVK